jgi:hypothetical protein
VITLFWIFSPIFKRYIKKSYLSKTKKNKFNESGQLLSFYLVSVSWALYIFSNVRFLIQFRVKFFKFNFLMFPYFLKGGLLSIVELFLDRLSTCWFNIFDQILLHRSSMFKIRLIRAFLGSNS